MEITYDTNTGNGTQYVSADFARQLERENAELLAALKTLVKQAEYHKAMIGLLEDALIDIAAYWDRGKRKESLSDACWHAVGTADKALEKLNEQNHDTNTTHRCTRPPPHKNENKTCL